MFAKSLTASLIVTGTIFAGASYGESEGGRSPSTTTEPTVRPDLAGVEKQIVSETNAFRRQEGRGALKVNPELSKAAQYFAKFMAETDKYGHTADGHEPWDRAKKYGYDYCMVEENIAYQFSSEGFTTSRLAQGFVDGWKSSPGHRRNMLNPDVDETAVAVARSASSGKFYAVQMFGRPKSE